MNPGTPTRDQSPETVNIVRAAVLLDGNRYGVIACPVCSAAGRDGGMVTYSVSGHGAVYARCTWPGCALVYR